MNYVKAIDKYLIVCFLFVFCSLVEYAIVLLLDRGKRKFEEKKKDIRHLKNKVRALKYNMVLQINFQVTGVNFSVVTQGNILGEFRGTLKKLNKFLTSYIRRKIPRNR